MNPYHNSDFFDESSGLSVELLSSIGLALLITALIFGPWIQCTAKIIWSYAKAFVLQRCWKPLRKIAAAIHLETRAWSLTAFSDKLSYELQKRHFDSEIQKPLWYQEAEVGLSDGEKELSEAIFEEFRNAGLTGEFDYDRARLRELRTRKLLQGLQKGYILHLHDNSMVSAEETLNEAIDHTWPWMRFNAHAELKDDRFSTNGRIEFKIEQWNEKKETQQIHDGIFNANEWVQVKSFLEQKFKGNRKDGIKCISEHLMVRPNRGWDQFSEITAVFKILITRHVFEWKFREVIRQCQRQLFSGIETRMMVFQKVGNDDGVGTIDIFEQLGILRAILKEQDDKEKEQTREDANHSHGEKHQKTDSRRVRISVVLATSRQFQLERMEEDFQKALECIEKYPDLITGFDVVGPESTQSCSSEQMYSFLKKAQHELRMLVDVEEYQSSHDVGLRLHAGESTVSYWSNFGLRLIHRPNSNVQMALDLGCKRISHFLAANDFQILQAKRQGVIIEACLITAQKLQAIDRIQDHPIHRWIDMGLKVAISPDNPSTYGCDFIDKFLYILWLGGPCCLWLLHNVIVNSIQGYLMGEEEEKRELAKFEADWTDWVKDSLSMIKDS